MVYGAIDLHIPNSQIPIVDADTQVLRDPRVLHERASDSSPSFDGLLPAAHPASRRAPRASASRSPSSLVRHHVLFSYPNYSPIYHTSRRLVKTYPRDVAAFAAANRRGSYRSVASRVSARLARCGACCGSRRQLRAVRSSLDRALAVAAAAGGLSPRLAGTCARVPARLARL